MLGEVWKNLRHAAVVGHLASCPKSAGCSTEPAGHAGFLFISFVAGPRVLQGVEEALCQGARAFCGWPTSPGDSEMAQ